MRIAVISSRHTRGGAASAADRLCRGFRLRGHALRRFVERLEGPADGAVPFTTPGRLGNAFNHVCAAVGVSPPAAWHRHRSARNVLRLLQQYQPDVINLHGFNQWAQPGLPWTIAADLAHLAPVVWTAHDCWPLNGVVDYPGEELGIPDPPRDSAALNRLAACGARLAIAGPSRWMADKARAAFDGRIFSVALPNGVDTSVFRPMPVSAAREVLGLPSSGSVVLAVAERLDSHRKGLDLLRATRAHLPESVCFAWVGEGFANPLDWGGRLLGALQDERVMRAAYAAADVVVVPSRLDNLPNILLESLACGTPCVGFAVGGIPDVIRPGESGYLARPFDPLDLAEQIKRLLDLSPGDSRALRVRCREIAETEYTLEAAADHYLALFQRMQMGGIL